LVAVGKELGRERDGAGVVLGLGGGVNEGADVGEEGGLAGVEERVEFGDGRVEAPGATVGSLGVEGEQAGLRNREVGAGRGVSGVVCAGRDDEVVGVVAAVEEEADEGLVVGADAGGGGGGGNLGGRWWGWRRRP
jgi:hypothetical protein